MLFVIGTTHQRAPIEVREKLSLSPENDAALRNDLTTLPGFAQSATGTVQGRVFNPISREYVGNAEVRLGGTDRVVFTESDGTFAFPGVAAGPASITVNFSGYTPATESFTVVAGQAAVREINLTSAAETPPAVKDGKVSLTAKPED